MKRFLTAFISVSLIISLTACGSKNKNNSSSAVSDSQESAAVDLVPEATDSAVSSECNIAFKDKITNLDPAFAEDSEASIVYHLLEGLYKYDQAGYVTYGIAESESVSDSGKVWTYKIRDNAVWSDGTPVTANDFVYAWKRAVDPKTGSPYAALFLKIKNASAIIEGNMDPSALGVEAVSDKELKVTFETTQFKTSTLFVHNVFMPLRSDLISEKIAGDLAAAGDGDKKAAYTGWSFNKQLYVTNGSYVPDTLSDDLVILNPSSTYYDKELIIAGNLNFKSYDNITSVYEDFTSGELTFSDYIDSSTVSAMYGTDDSPLKASNTLGTIYVSVNNGSGVLSNSDVRKALLLCVNQNDVSNELLNSFAPATGFMSSAFAGENRGESFRVAAGFPLSFTDILYNDNVESAKELLTSAGFSNGNGFPELEFIYNSESSSEQQIVITLIRCWNEKLGITVHANGLSSEEYSARINSKDYELAMLSISSEVDDPMLILKKFVTGLSANNANISDYDYDCYIDQAINAYDYSEYLTCLEQADLEIVKNALLIPIGFNSELYLQSDHISNVVVTGTGLKLFMFSSLV